jgi:urocanate hydratase
MLEFQRRGAEVFEYGNGLRARAQMLGVEDAFEMGVFTERYIRPLFCQGIGPFRWLAISGNPQDIHEVDALILERFAGEPITDWIVAAREAVQFTGLPARIGWLGYGDRRKLGLLVNDAVASGRISGPIAFTRDHLDSGSVAAPVRETERMRDGSDGIADWPILNALLNTASHADLVAVHGFGGQAQSAGATTVADGTAQAAERLGAVLTNDPGIGVLRYADAGYETAAETAARADWGSRWQSHPTTRSASTRPQPRSTTAGRCPLASMRMPTSTVARSSASSIATGRCSARRASWPLPATTWSARPGSSRSSSRATPRACCTASSTSAGTARTRSR